MHPACAQQHLEALGEPFTPPVCKHWRDKGFCVYDSDCFYRHPPLDGITDLPRCSLSRVAKPGLCTPV